MASIKLLCSRGHDVVTWDEEKIGIGDPETVAAVATALTIFNETRAMGGSVLVEAPGQAAKRIDQFDPRSEMIAMPPFQGG